MPKKKTIDLTDYPILNNYLIHIINGKTFVQCAKLFNENVGRKQFTGKSFKIQYEKEWADLEKNEGETHWSVFNKKSKNENNETIYISDKVEVYKGKFDYND